MAVVSRREVEGPRRFASIAAALADHEPAYVVVANRTSEHRAALADLAAAGFRGTVLVEKPLYAEPAEHTAGDAAELPFERLYVGYNLRFHPGLVRLRDLLAGERVLSVQVYAGQYLPDWRPGRDYRDGYSAARAAGGGVLRDLSHELDYLTWMLGSWRAVAAAGGRLSGLDIDGEDTVVALLELAGCPAVALQLNYLDRVGRRSVLVNGESRTVELDLVAGRLRIASADDGGSESFDAGRDTTYRRQHRAALDGEDADLCTVEQAMEVLRLVAAIERAIATRSWVTR